MNKMKTGTALFAAAILGTGAIAQGAVQKGTWELGFSGSYSALEAGDVDIDLLLANVEAGYFVTNAIQVSGAVSYLDAEISDLGIDALLLGVGADYHFVNESNFVSYVGGGLHWVEADVAGGHEDDFAWELRAGLKHFVAQNVAIKYEVSYLSFDDLDLDGWNFGVGLSFFF